MDVTVSTAVHTLSGQVRRGGIVTITAACLAFSACLMLSACTGGGGVAAGADSVSATVDGAVGDSAEDEMATGDAGAGSDDAGDPAPRSVGGGKAGGVPALPPPGPLPQPLLDAEQETADALAAMPGLYGLVLLRPEVFADRIEFEANADCATVMDVLQSGQWALELGGGDLGGAAVGEPDAAADGADGAVTRLATLRLGGDVAPVRLIDAGGTCSGTIVRPAGG